MRNTTTKNHKKIELNSASKLIPDINQQNELVKVRLQIPEKQLFNER